MDALMKLDLPAGVDVEIKAFGKDREVEAEAGGMSNARTVWLELKGNMSPGILGKKIGMTQVFRRGRAGGAGHAAEGGTLRGGAAQDAGHRRLRRGAARSDRVHQASSASTSRRPGHLKKAGAEGVQVHARVPPAAGDGDLKPGDQILVGSVQAQRQGGRDRHQQGPRLRGRRQAPSFPRRRRHARFDVPSRSRFDRRVRASRRACSRACAWAATWERTG